MDAWMEVLVFAGKGFSIFLFLVLLILVVALVVTKNQMKPHVEVEILNDKHQDLVKFLKSHILKKKDLKTFLKNQKKAKDDEKNKQLFVLKFDGDIKANGVESLREEVSMLLEVANPQDKVLLKLESPGGMVHGYGLAAAQLLRLKHKGIPLIVSVDKMAASGGYLMAATAQHILAAPFAIVGSIGVIAQVPNFHRLLKKLEIDYNEYTAGEFKRTVSLLGEITPKGEEKFKEQLEHTHVLFKDFVQNLRPQLDVPKISTGEHWYGKSALELKLIDEIMTSDEFIQNHLKDWTVISLKYAIKEKIGDKIAHLLSKAMIQTIAQIQTLTEKSKY